VQKIVNQGRAARLGQAPEIFLAQEAPRKVEKAYATVEFHARRPRKVRHAEPEAAIEIE
jgi:hypothetical protein